MTTNDPVPEADRLEQESPTGPQDRPGHRPHADASDADAFEQQLPLSDAATDDGIDAERSEPFEDYGDYEDYGESTSRD